MTDERSLESKARMSELCARLVRGTMQAEAQATWPVPHVDEALARDLATLTGLCEAVGALEQGRSARELQGMLDALREKGRFEGEPVERFLALIDAIQRFADEATVRRPSHTEAVDANAASGGAARPLGAEMQRNTHAPTSDSASPASVASPLPAQAAAALNTAGATHATADSKDPRAPRDGETKPDAGFLRVPVGLLDHLMGLVGELVLIRNQFLQSSLSIDTHQFHTVSQRLNVVTAGLQAEVMRMRMQPVSTVTLRFQRLVRDVAMELGKLVDLALEGNETEIDKTIIEAIRDPLTHILRNALDHGIEPPEERLRFGKRQRGRIVVRSYQEGGQVIVEVEDDGRGIDLGRLSRKALEAGVVTSERLSRMTPQEIAELIFTAGLSTVDKVTDISGRGVGMDVVKTNIEQLGGVVELTNRPGRGLITRLRIPLTLAIVPALVVRSGANHFAIPQVKIVELLRLDASRDDGRQVEHLEGGPVLRLRGRLLPLLSLKDVLSPRAERPASEEADQGSIVVLNTEGHALALRVDEVCDSIDIVVKPFVSFLKSLRAFSGATILGDGTLALILDVAGLCQLCGLDARRRADEEAGVDDAASSQVRAREHVRFAHEFLLCRLGPGEVVAVPLPQVFRLEEFPGTAIEFASTTPVIRYRDGLLPLIPLGRALCLATEFDAGVEFEELVTREHVDVVVVRRHSRSFGLVVAGIEDIISATGEVAELVKPRPGALGTLLHGNDVHTVVHVDRIVDAWMREALGEEPPGSTEGKPPLARVLLVEDSGFFRKYVGSALEGARFHVTPARNGREALEILRAAPQGSIDVVLTALDMPEMNGFDFARAVRAEEGWFQRLPLVALTTHCSPKDRAVARAAGIDEHIEKIQLDQVPALLAAALGVHGRESGTSEDVA